MTAGVDYVSSIMSPVCIWIFMEMSSWSPVSRLDSLKSSEHRLALCIFTCMVCVWMYFHCAKVNISDTIETSVLQMASFN